MNSRVKQRRPREKEHETKETIFWKVKCHFRLPAPRLLKWTVPTSPTDMHLRRTQIPRRSYAAVLYKSSNSMVLMILTNWLVGRVVDQFLCWNRKRRSQLSPATIPKICVYEVWTRYVKMRAEVEFFLAIPPAWFYTSSATRMETINHLAHWSKYAFRACVLW